MQYSRTVSLPKDGATSLPLMFDYVFTDSEGNTSVPVTLLVEDADKGTLLASSSFRLSCAQGENKDIQFDFLTTSPEDGVGFNPGFDGDQEVELPVE